MYKTRFADKPLKKIVCLIVMGESVELLLLDNVYLNILALCKFFGVEEASKRIEIEVMTEFSEFWSLQFGTFLYLPSYSKEYVLLFFTLKIWNNLQRFTSEFPYSVVGLSAAFEEQGDEQQVTLWLRIVSACHERDLKRG